MKILVLSLVSRPLEALVVVTLVIAVVFGTVFIFGNGTEPAPQQASVTPRMPQSIELNQDEILNLQVKKDSKPIVFEQPSSQFVLIEKAKPSIPTGVVVQKEKMPLAKDNVVEASKPESAKFEKAPASQIVESFPTKERPRKSVMTVNGVEYEIPIRNKIRNDIQTVRVGRHPEPSGIGVSVEGVKLSKLSGPKQTPAKNQKAVAINSANQFSQPKSNETASKNEAKVEPVGQFQTESSLNNSSKEQFAAESPNEFKPLEKVRDKVTQAIPAQAQFEAPKLATSGSQSAGQFQPIESVAHMKPAKNVKADIEKPLVGQFQAEPRLSNNSKPSSQHEPETIAKFTKAQVPPIPSTNAKAEMKPAQRKRVSVAKREVFDPAAERLRHSTLFGPKTKRRFRFGF